MEKLITYSNEVRVRMTYVSVELELNLADFHNLSTVIELYSTIVGAVHAVSYQPRESYALVCPHL